MCKARLWITLGCCLFALAVFAWTQSKKAGLWEVTAVMTWQQSPMPQGMPARPGSPFGGGPRTTQVCITQAMLDKYGGPPPQTRGDCQVTNLQKSADGMSASIACTGQMSATGTVEGSWTDDEHSKSRVHMTGTMQMGPNSVPVEWTVESTSVFKSADCGSVRPAGSGNEATPEAATSTTQGPQSCKELNLLRRTRASRAKNRRSTPLNAVTTLFPSPLPYAPLLISPNTAGAPFLPRSFEKISWKGGNPRTPPRGSFLFPIPYSLFPSLFQAPVGPA
jgi:hypothetical protein